MEVKFYVMSGTRQIGLVSKALNDLETNIIVLLIDTYGYTNAMNTGLKTHKNKPMHFIIK